MFPNNHIRESQRDGPIAPSDYLHPNHIWEARYKLPETKNKARSFEKVEWIPD